MLILVKKEADDFHSEKGVACEQLFTEITWQWSEATFPLIPAHGLQRTETRLEPLRAGASLCPGPGSLSAAWALLSEAARPGCSGREAGTPEHRAGSVGCALRPWCAAWCVLVGAGLRLPGRGAAAAAEGRALESAGGLRCQPVRVLFAGCCGRGSI